MEKLEKFALLPAIQVSINHLSPYLYNDNTNTNENNNDSNNEQCP